MALVNPPSECIAEALKEFNSTPEHIKDDVQVLKSWLAQQPHLPQVDDDKCIEIMLLRCKCSVERTKKAWDMHFTLKTALPEFFGDRDPMAVELQAVMDHMEIVPLKQVTSEGYRVVVIKCLQKDASKFQPEMFCKYAMMIADVRLQEDSSLGDIYIYDCDNVGIGHISKMTPTIMKKIEVCAAQGYRARIKGVHFVNAPAVVDVLMTMIKAVVKSKMAARHHVHNTLESLHGHVDKHLLPEELGGDAGKLADLGAEWRKRTEGKREWFLEQEGAGKVDESKRPGESINPDDLFGIEGTFKQLAVD